MVKLPLQNISQSFYSPFSAKGKDLISPSMIAGGYKGRAEEIEAVTNEEITEKKQIKAVLLFTLLK